MVLRRDMRYAAATMIATPTSAASIASNELAGALASVEQVVVDEEQQRTGDHEPDDDLGSAHPHRVATAKRVAERNPIGCRVRPSSARSARISPMTLANLNPWPEQAEA